MTAELIQQGAQQIQVIASVESLLASLTRLGYGERTPLIFCWHSSDAAEMQLFAQSPQHWTYADSDCDA
jgi:hypothetical protein